MSRLQGLIHNQAAGKPTWTRNSWIKLTRY